MQLFRVNETRISTVHKHSNVVIVLGQKNVWGIAPAEKGKHMLKAHECLHLGFLFRQCLFMQGKKND